jgi:dTDP-glucose 4,6-dehydratase
MCLGFFALMQSDFHEPVNIGNPIEMTVLEMAKTVQKLTGNTNDFDFRPLPQNDPKLRRPDISRAKEVLGWQPQVSLESGLAHTLEFFKTSELKPLF